MKELLLTGPSRVYLLNDIMPNAGNPEDEAMLQSLYSRSSDSVLDHLKRLEATGSSKFMEQFYIGYNHDSIGDLGHVTIFIENVSMLCAKTLEDTALYAGVECSSRYLDFEHREIINPKPNSVLPSIQEECMRLYRTVLDATYTDLLSRYPKPEDTTTSVWEKALKARAFDVARGYLPAGVTTNLSMHMSIREFLNRTLSLIHHPLEEVRLVNDKIFCLLKNKYPTSFKLRKSNAEQIVWDKRISILNNYSISKFYPKLTNTNTPPLLTEEQLQIALERPMFRALPREFERAGTLVMEGSIDFGGHRDLHRHRNGYCPLPILSAGAPFHKWYYDSLPESIATTVIADTKALLKWIVDSKIGSFEAQYSVPMGITVPISMTYTIPQMVYVLELRSNVAVHPTVRGYIKELIRFMDQVYPRVALYVDRSPDRLDPKRGTQDITPIPR